MLLLWLARCRQDGPGHLAHSSVFDWPEVHLGGGVAKHQPPSTFATFRKDGQLLSCWSSRQGCVCGACTSRSLQSFYVCPVHQPEGRQAAAQE